MQDGRELFEVTIRKNHAAEDYAEMIKVQESSNGKRRFIIIFEGFTDKQSKTCLYFKPFVAYLDHSLPMSYNLDAENNNRFSSQTLLPDCLIVTGKTQAGCLGFLVQNLRFIPLCLSISFAVCLDLILPSTVIFLSVIGLYQISWSPFPCLTKLQPNSASISLTFFSYSAIYCHLVIFEGDKRIVNNLWFLVV